MAKEDNIIVGLDIGTTKISTVVAEITDDGVDIIGLGSSLSKGLRKGVVINIESTVDSIRKSVEEAEGMSRRKISSVFTGIAGGHIRGINSHGIVALKEGEVRSSDLDRVFDAAQAVAIPLDREVIHVIPQEFVVDEQDGIRDPVGMAGVRLEAKVHIVTAAVTSAQNIVKCCNRAGLNVQDIILEQLASAEATLTPEEKELGVVLLDIGGGTTDLAVFSGGSLVHTTVLSIGGNHVTNDIAVGLRTPFLEAEKIKLRYGCALTSLVQKDETIEVPSIGGGADRILSRQILSEIVEPRIEELLTLIRQEIVKSGYEDLVPSGVVLTGGSTLLPGMIEIAEQVFNLPVRIGVPHGIGGLVEVVKSPLYATGVGLVRFGSQNQGSKLFCSREGNVYSRVKERMREWLEEIF
ncbi:MAG: cell division protein FtsA [Deltaproteobacteria bacterium]|nr:cell division protein FtsA [Deltaproteobacteria bacterium]